MKKIVMFIVVNILLSFLISVEVENVSADTVSFYVSNDGDNSNDGKSPSSPWRTIGKVVTALGDGTISQGDDIYFNRGDVFNDAQLDLDENIGGTSSNWMTIGAYGSGAKPILSYNSASDSIIFIDATISHIIIEDIHFTTNQFHCILSNLHSSKYFSHLTIRRCDFDNLNGAFGIYLRCGEYYKIENCYFDVDSNADHCVAIGGSVNHQISNGIIRNCTMKDCKDGINIHFREVYSESVGPNHWIENCVISNWATGESGIDVSPGDNGKIFFIENCELYGGGGNGAIALAHGTSDVVIDNVHIHDISKNGIIAIVSENTIIRNSIIEEWHYDDQGFLTQTTGWIYDTYLYNNNFVNKQTSSSTESMIDFKDGSENGFICKNNIFYSTDSDDPDNFVLVQGSTFENINAYFSHNMWWRGDGGSGDETWWDDSGPADTYAQWVAESFTDGELRDDPEFTNAVNSNYNLQSTSPCIDAGDWLTTANGGGSGSTITVQDAGYFFQGISNLGISGDNIFVGGNTDLTITNVNYDSNTITVDQSISWSDGDTVSLYSYQGNAPDIGAIESYYSGSDITPPQISNINLLESDPLDTEEAYGWINITATVTDGSGISSVKIDISCPDGSNINVSMDSIGSTYYYNTSNTFSDHGGYSYYIWAVDTNGNGGKSTDNDFSMPPNWDVNEDGTCNLLDQVAISNHFGEIGNHGWIREDIDNNGIIQVLDCVILSLHNNENW